jgi:lipoprotein-anchoring transpeptidase ErfK/SrfK
MRTMKRLAGLAMASFLTVFGPLAAEAKVIEWVVVKGPARAAINPAPKRPVAKSLVAPASISVRSKSVTRLIAPKAAKPNVRQIQKLVVSAPAKAEPKIADKPMPRLAKVQPAPSLKTLSVAATPPITNPGTVLAKVDLSTQNMNVFVDGHHAYSWRISSGRPGFPTVRGTFRPQSLAVMHYSKKYDNAPMPHAIFIHGGFAIHGTSAIRQLGRPASHGCVRLHPSNAATLFSLVQKAGPSKTTVVIAN